MAGTPPPTASAPAAVEHPDAGVSGELAPAWLALVPVLGGLAGVLAARALARR